MKLNKWLYGAMALGMLAACSDKDVAPGSGGENGENKFTSGISYLGVSIELPSELGSRAEDNAVGGNQYNDNFDDGLPVEYNVDNAAILLFWGKDENSAKFVGAYTLQEDETFSQPDNDNITTSFHRTIKVLNKPELDENDTETKLWGLAIVNYKDGKNNSDDHFHIDSSEDSSNYGNLTVKSAFGVDAEGNLTVAEDKVINRLKDGSANATTFREFRKYITECEFLSFRDENKTSLKNIFMTNAPLSDKAGTQVPPTGLKIQTLAQLDYSKFESTQVAAQNNPAGCIFVERAVAKITCSSFPKTTTLSHAIVDDKGEITTENISLNIVSVGWMVDNEEDKSYIIRNAAQTTDMPFWSYANTNTFTGLQRYRFVGNTDMTSMTPADGGNHTWFRTYWCMDPNYTNDKPYIAKATSTATYAPFVSSTNGTNQVWASYALYPHENTFDVAHQQYKNTTRVVFKVQYGKLKEDGNTLDDEFILYAIRGQLNNFYLKEDADKLLKRAFLSSNEIPEIIRKCLKPNLNIDEVPINEAAFDFVIGNASKDEASGEIKLGDYIIKSVNLKSTFVNQYLAYSEDYKATDVQAALNEEVESANDLYHIVPFTDNTCYYALYVQHFGDSYCKLPVKTDESGNVIKDESGKEIDDWKGENTTEVYENNNEQKYLGRYGLVRNNWYDIQIGKIGRLGNADVPDGNLIISDDNKTEEWYLSARIHVLSWAKRTQHHDF